MNAFSLSVFILTLNEADRIERTIQSVGNIASEIIVVDSGSTDGTIKIAQSLGAKVTHNEWPGYGAQKIFAQNLCTHDWVLNLDADEVVTDDLQNEILSLFQHGEPPLDAYAIKFVDIIPGEQKPRKFAYFAKRIRLYHKSAGQFSTSPIHDSVIVNQGKTVGLLNAKALHFSMRNIGEELIKFNGYTDAQVANLQAKGRKISTWRMYFEFPLAFLKAYFLRRRFLEGKYGFLTAMNYAIFRHLRIAKYHEAKILQKKSLLPNFKPPLNPNDDTDANRDSSE